MHVTHTHTQTHTHTLLLAQRKIRLTGSKGYVGLPFFKGTEKKERKCRTKHWDNVYAKQYNKYYEKMLANGNIHICHKILAKPSLLPFSIPIHFSLTKCINSN